MRQSVRNTWWLRNFCLKYKYIHTSLLVFRIRVSMNISTRTKKYFFLFQLVFNNANPMRQEDMYSICSTCSLFMSPYLPIHTEINRYTGTQTLFQFYNYTKMKNQCEFWSWWHLQVSMDSNESQEGKNK